MFVLANIIIKILPLWWLWNTEYNLKDLVAGIVLFIMYTIWLYSNDAINNNEIGVYKKIDSTIDGIKRNEPTTPFTYFIINRIGA